MIALLQNKIFLGALCTLGVAVLDLVFALNPNSKANGVLHWLYLLFSGGVSSSPTPPTPPTT